MYSHLLHAVGQQSGVAPLAFPAFYTGAAGEGPSAASIVQQLQAQQSGLLLGHTAGIYPHHAAWTSAAFMRQAAPPTASELLAAAGAAHMLMPGGLVPASLPQPSTSTSERRPQQQEHKQQHQPPQQQSTHRQQNMPAHPAPQLPKAVPPPASEPSTPAPSLKAAIDWRGAFAASPQPRSVLPPDHPGKGLQGLSELQLGAFEVLLAETPQAANLAIEALRSRMWDGIVAMGIEWAPESSGRGGGGSGGGGEPSPAALLQLSTAGLVVVLRTGSCGLPDAFRRALVEDSDVELVVASWSSSDERKFEECFGIETFWCKITELQKVAKACGHSKTGVKALVQAVLEPAVNIPKNKKFLPADWAAPVLRPEQLKYAVLDAACTEHVFRCLEGRF
ncbi:hypothetical protein Agub_g13158 [Astrephomene gubernaculifera]|uniref:3'-5' exonuclease domain-containing protein n=1 Tax=Astrephomene gubernaculifera TaxID=47775 RepID=A0AAD3HSD9_9CHLO|nr:hypothetical protein Agub_g13158 [Astrephomene gubernaculifera]